MSKHTPGPWNVLHHNNGKLYVTSSDPDGLNDTLFLAELCRPSCLPDTESTARLMAAAPELLAALERTLSNAIGHACDARGDDCNFEDWPWVQQAREAINNATKEGA